MLKDWPLGSWKNNIIAVTTVMTTVIAVPTQLRTKERNDIKRLRWMS